MTSSSTAYIDKPTFDELLKYTKQNADICKEMVAVLQERSDLELSYQKALSKLSVRANKINPTTGGTFLNAWKTLSKQFEQEAQSHKTISIAIVNDAIKPMKKLMEQRAKERKSADAPVDKAIKAVTDRKNDVFKAQKNLLSKTKEFESTAAGSEATKNNKGKELSQKERSKLSTKHGKTSEAINKADREYFKAVKTAEQTRFQRIITMNHTAFALQNSESAYMEEIKKIIIKFVDVLGQIIPLIRGNYDAMKNGFASVTCATDVQNAIVKGNQATPEEQVLYDCFEDDMNISLSQRHRQYHLQRKLEMLDNVVNNVQKEQKSSGGKSVDKLPPNYSYLETIQDKDMTNLWNASRYRLVCALATVNSKPKPSNPVATYIRSEKDRSGGVKSFLNIPRDQKGQATLTVSTTSASGMTVDLSVENTKVQPVAAPQNPAPPSANPIPAAAAVAAAAPPAPAPPPAAQTNTQNTPFDEDGDDWDDEPDSGEKYVALYDFEPAGEGELALKAGDSVLVTQKDDDGWWNGTVNGITGQFPESYVKKADGL
ncbi:nostrin-like [Apostichopus japonicus]|uniref:nostrin-like n=1 Tax=Stichopus japonicus TaxID=307972 RepID=UPI003AB67E75